MHSSALKYRDGVRLENCQDCVITGNVLNDMQDDSLYLKDSTDCSVSGNQITNPRKRGIVLDNTTRCRISDNSIVERREDRLMPVAIEVVGKLNLIQNNALTKGLKGDILCGVKHGKVQGNTVWG
jgi:parallel beta-helix repeat protein